MANDHIRQSAKQLAILLVALASALLTTVSTPVYAQFVSPPDFGFVIEDIEVLPDTREMEVMVRRQIGFEIGDRVPQGTLVESKARLEAAGTFEQVDVHTRRGSVPGAIVVIVEAEIGRRIHFETGIGHEDLGGWYLNMFGLRWTSPLHRGGTAQIGVHSGLETSGLFANLEVPGIPRPDYDGLVEIAFFDRTWYVQDGRDEYRQTLHQHRLLLGARHRLEGGVTTTLWTGVVQVNPSDSLTTEQGGEDVEVPTSPFLPPPNTTHFLDARLLIERDRRAVVDPWRNGTWMGARLRVAEELDHGGFWQVEGDARKYVPALERSALALRLQAHYTSSGTPYHQRFLVGGAGRLRGFSSGRLSSPLGARAMWVGSAEWRHPLLGIDRPEPRLLGTLFVDVGSHWAAHGKPEGLSAGVGYGLQIQIPWVQVVTLEIGYPITDEPDVDSVVGTLTLGRSF